MDRARDRIVPVSVILAALVVVWYVAAILLNAPGSQPVTVHSPEHSDAYLYVLTEHRPTIANRRNAYRVVAGPDDVDLDYYPTWLGLKRIVVVDAPVAGFLTGLRFGGRDMVPR